jgi:4-hydroxybenzoate polyprenyltransferase
MASQSRPKSASSNEAAIAVPQLDLIGAPEGAGISAAAFSPSRQTLQGTTFATATRGASFMALACGPLTERIKLGEGALLAINGCWILAATLRNDALWPRAIGLALLSTLVLIAAYAVNDWHDARGDLADPKKNQRLVRGYIDHRRSFGAFLAGLHVALPVAAYFAFGLPQAAAVLAMLGINAIYSWLLKGVPIIDLIVVGLWGGAFVAIVDAPVWLCVTVGLMTSIMHLFQIEQDRHVDAANHIRTTVVSLPGAALSMLILICIALGIVLYREIGLIGAISAVIPLVLYRLVADTGRAWMACRIYCGLVLLAALGVFNGTG